jgi:hypothetical protein
VPRRPKAFRSGTPKTQFVGGNIQKSMSLSKRTYEFSDAIGTIAAVRNKRVKNRFAIDVNFPSFTLGWTNACQILSFDSGVLSDAVEKLPRFATYYKHDGDFKPSFSGMGMSSIREVEEYAYHYRGKWLAELDDVKVLMKQELFNYDRASGSMDLVQMMNDVAISARSDGFKVIRDAVREIDFVILSNPELKRIVTPIEKPDWIDKAVASHAEASAAQA